MHLAKLYNNFKTRHYSYSFRMLEIYDLSNTPNDWEFHYKTEVLIADIWQFWCKFCRELLMSSIQGTTARNGNLIASRTGNNSYQRIAYEAMCAKSNRNTNINGHLNFQMWKEPTWGDIDCFLRLVNSMNPSNSNQLQAGFGSFYKIKDLQQVRNACAHKNVQTINNIKTLSINYTFSNLKCATELPWKRTLNSSEMAIETWLYEMNQIAEIVTYEN